MTAVSPWQHAATASGSRHFVRFYEEEDFFLTEVAEFIDGSLAVGGVGIVIATEEHLAQLEQRLRYASAIGVTDRPSGRLVALNAAETLARFMVDGRPDAERFDRVVGSVVEAACAGGAPVHAFGEMVALLCEDGLFDAALELEELWNEMGSRHRFELFCGYPSRVFASSDHVQAFEQVCRAHSHVCPSERLGRSQDPAELNRLLASWEQKAAALEAEVVRRKEAEATLRGRERELADFLENAAEGLHRVAADGTILWANRAELELLGYGYDEYVGRHIADFHLDQDVIQSMLRLLTAGETLRDHPARLRAKDGSVKHVLIHSNACFEDGKLAYTRCFTRDATDRVVRQQERDELLARLSEANRVKDDFLAMLGHELRNPLAPIVTALHLMRMRGETGTGREQEIIKRQLDHLVRLVDDLLDISKVTRGKIELKKQWVSISDVLAKALEMSSPLLEQRSHQLSVAVEDGLAVHGDPVRLAQVVANLLTNAARYTKSGGVLSLDARKAAENEQVVITVKDNGIGIPEEALSKVFDAFFQGPRGAGAGDGGLGIGLALVKSFVSLHDGSVAVRSDGPGLGSEFTVSIPVGSESSHLDATGKAPTAAKRDGPALRILMVDDNIDAAETLAQLLRVEGHVALVLNDPFRAMNEAAEFDPDLVIMDIGMPVMDGYELAAQLRQNRALAKCRFVALSGYGQNSDRARSAAAGLSEHFVKPVDPDQLLKFLNTVKPGAVPASS